LVSLILIFIDMTNIDKYLSKNNKNLLKDIKYLLITWV